MTTAVPRVGADVLNDLDRRLAPADADLAARYPGDEGTRQPVHSVHVPADQLTPDVLAKLEREPVEDLAALTGRLSNDPATELRVAADEHRRITRLRLERLMQG